MFSSRLYRATILSFPRETITNLDRRSISALCFHLSLLKVYYRTAALLALYPTTVIYAPMYLYAQKSAAAASVSHKRDAARPRCNIILMFFYTILIMNILFMYVLLRYPPRIKFIFNFYFIFSLLLCHYGCYGFIVLYILLYYIIFYTNPENSILCFTFFSNC